MYHNPKLFNLVHYGNHIQTKDEGSLLDRSSILAACLIKRWKENNTMLLLGLHTHQGTNA